MITNCLYCKKEFFIFPSIKKAGKGKYCSLACRGKSQVGSKPWWEKRGLKRLENTGRTWINRLKEKNPEIEERRLMAMQRGEDHCRWKGASVGYVALHDWVRNKLGKPQECFFCLTTDKRIYHWANVSGKYQRNIGDWIRLCVPCHKNFDLERNK